MELKKIITDDCLGAPIDSTLPINKIAQQFFSKNLGVRTHYNYFSTLTEASLKYDHNLHPGFPLNTFRDDWDGILPYKYFQQFNLKCTMPKIISRMMNVEKLDPVTKPLEEIHLWERKIRHMAFFFKCLRSQHKNKLFGKIDKNLAYCMKQVANLAVAIENRPEPYLRAPYNWLYAGNGNLQHIAVNEINCLLFSVLNITYLSEFRLNDLKINYDHKAVFDCGQGNNVLETIHSNQVVALRLRYKIIILKINDEEQTSFNKLKEIDSKIEYTSINFDSVHKNILYITTLDSNLKIVNIDLMKARSVQLTKPNSLIDNWNAVGCLDRSSYCHIQNKTMYIYDKRTNSVVHDWGDPNVISTSTCNLFSGFKKCDNINFMYLATNHHIFLADLRFSSDHKPRYVQRWTHQCNYPPIYISICPGEGIRDVVGVRSQWDEDLIVFTNESKSFDFGMECTSISMPYQPPSLRSTLITARNQLLSFDSLNPIEQRLFTSSTGLQLIENDHTYLVMSLNSLGDLSCHILFSPKLSSIQDDGPEILEEWSKSYKSNPKTLNITKFTDISGLWKNLREISDDSPITGDRELIAMMQRYSHKEVIDTFENDELDKGLIDAWAGFVEDDVRTTHQNLMEIDLYSDSD